MICLPHFYRFTAVNAVGQTLTTVTLKARRNKLGTDGSVTFEGSEASLINASSIANNTSTSSSGQDNSTNKYLGGDFTFSVVAPASSNGDVTLYLERSTDGGTTWDDAQLGVPVAVMTFSTSGTKTRTFSI